MRLSRNYLSSCGAVISVTAFYAEVRLYAAQQELLIFKGSEKPLVMPSFGGHVIVKDSRHNYA